MEAKNTNENLMTHADHSQDLRKFKQRCRTEPDLKTVSQNTEGKHSSNECFSTPLGRTMMRSL